MATLNILDINDRGWVVRGDISGAASPAGISGVTTALTWFDLGNPQTIFPFMTRGGGPLILGVSVEGVFTATVQIIVSLRDSAPGSTPAGASTLAWPILGSTSNASQLFTINQPVRWIAYNVSAWTSGFGSVWVYGVLPK